MKWISAAMLLTVWLLLALQMPLRRQRFPAGLESGLQGMIGQEQAGVKEVLGLMESKRAEEPRLGERSEPFMKKARLVDSLVTSCSDRRFAWYRLLRAGNGRAQRSLRLLKKSAGDSLLRELDLTLDALAEQVSKWVRPEFSQDFSQPFTAQDGFRDAASYAGSWRRLYSGLDANEAGSLLLAQILKLRMSERRILQQLYSDGFTGGYRFSAVLTLAVPSRKRVLPGEPLTAQFVFAAYRPGMEADAMADKGTLTFDRGIFTWRSVARGSGWQRVSGTIRELYGKPGPVLDWSFEYFVLPGPSAFLQTRRPSLLYRCQPNEVQLQAAAGYDLNALELRVPGAAVVKLGDGKYTVTVTDGRLRHCRGLLLAGKDTIGALLMDIVEVPLPLPDLSGAVSLAALKTLKVLPLRETEGVAAEVVSYQVRWLPAGNAPDELIDVASGRFAGNAAVDALLNRAAPGDRLLFSTIRIRQGCSVRALPGAVNVRVIPD